MTFPIQVFDPPLCCSTGVCGTDVDPELVRFAADLDWLAKQGVEVERLTSLSSLDASPTIRSSQVNSPHEATAACR